MKSFYLSTLTEKQAHFDFQAKRLQMILHILVRYTSRTQLIAVCISSVFRSDQKCTTRLNDDHDKLLK
jgi:hypothetical protein